MLSERSALFFRERAALVDADSIDRALRVLQEKTGCAVEAGRALVQTFTVDLDVLAGLMPPDASDLRPLPSLA